MLDRNRPDNPTLAGKGGAFLSGIYYIHLPDSKHSVMKNLILSLVGLFLLSTAANAQLTGMSPNQAIHNQTLQTTITSNGLFVQAMSPNGNVFQIFLKQGG